MRYIFNEKINFRVGNGNIFAQAGAPARLARWGLVGQPGTGVGICQSRGTLGRKSRSCRQLQENISEVAAQLSGECRKKLSTMEHCAIVRQLLTIVQ